MWPSLYSCSVRTSTRMMASSESSRSFALSAAIFPPFLIWISSVACALVVACSLVAVSVIAAFVVSLSVSGLVAGEQAVSHVKVMSNMAMSMMPLFMFGVVGDAVCFIGTPPDEFYDVVA